MAKDTYLKKILGGDQYERVRNSKVLMVGAGGIGCELLKDLVLTGYGQIHIVDLDTITLSNLNRQFLFRRTDIDKSKSLTVANAVQSFNYLNTKLIPHHGNIMDSKQFPIHWWNQFDYIFNALDNLEARRHVNKMCLFLKKPLMESGTTGFEGQIQPIFPYYSECFDCQAKETPKTYPVCTIRSTPSSPVHCITWAKEFLFHQLFDEADQVGVNDAEKIAGETDDKEEQANLAKEANELIELRNSINSKDSNGFINELIEKIFKVDIERLLLIETLWKARTKPIPLPYDEYKSQLEELVNNPLSESILKNETKVWSVLENLYVLYKSSVALQTRINGGEPFITFDKDDEDTLDFVVSSANLRSSIFHIETKSKFDIKQIAGNIIPAIATTNAIISGFSCLGGTSYFKHDPKSIGQNYSSLMEDSRTVYISIRPNKYITSALLSEPNPKCASSSISRGVLEINENDLKSKSLSWLVNSLIDMYGYEEEGLSISLGQSKLIYDVDFNDNLDTILSNINGFKDGELILIQDDDDVFENLELYITVKKDQPTELPDIKLGKKIFEKEEEDEDDEEDKEDYSMEEINAGDTIIIDDGDEIELIDEEIEPAYKKRKVDN
ncbi:uncharacterized protein RJT21DRAFT_19484 [Scheffersomyces amazonensis]|uniref:uncharacterized protein n=1 Tax=Scheffersomyces amazonensis TaxID=1078765 RepID=UPI00315DA951